MAWKNNNVSGVLHIWNNKLYFVTHYFVDIFHKTQTSLLTKKNLKMYILQLKVSKLMKPVYLFTESAHWAVRGGRGNNSFFFAKKKIKYYQPLFWRQRTQKYWCYYPHRSRDSVSHVCRIFIWYERPVL